jgi:hypothetical protein
MAKRLVVGDKVTTKVKKPAWYSGYSGLPRVNFSPGDVGTLAVIDKGRGGSQGWPTRYLVDFQGPFMGDPIHNNTTWRVALSREEIRRA